MAGIRKKAETARKAVTPMGLAQENGRLVCQMLNAFIRGKDEGDKRVRAAALVEELWRLATRAEDERVRLAAVKEIIDRVDGKAVERKEIRSLKIEGVLYLPPADEVKPAVEERKL